MFTPLLIAARTAHIGASILLAGIFTFDAIILSLSDGVGTGDFQEVERRLLRLAVWSLIAAILSGLLWFWLEVASMNELSLKNALSAAAWRTVLFETRFGRVWQLRSGVIVAAFPLIWLCRAQVKARSALILILWLLSVVFLASLALISHAAAASIQPLGLLGDMLHLCAVGGWTGGLVPLVIFLARTRASLALGEIVAVALQRFSTLSLCCVSVLVVSGLSNSWLLVGSIHALFTTSYGRLLLFKLALFSILLAFGARNRFLVKAKLPNAAADKLLLCQLRRNVICEVCLGAAVVAIVACLGITPPARTMVVSRCDRAIRVSAK
jgi:putative copper resistance protein D